MGKLEDKFLELIDKGEALAPALTEHLIGWKIMMNCWLSFIFVMILAVGIWFIYKAIDEDWDGPALGLPAIILPIIGFIGICFTIPDLLQLIYYPDIYLLEWIAHHLPGVKH